MKHNYVYTTIVNTETHDGMFVKLTNIHVTNNGTVYITWIDDKGNEHVKLSQADMTAIHIDI